MSADETNIDYATGIEDFYYQTIVIAFDSEDRAIIPDDACAWILTSYRCRCIPISRTDLPMPIFQWLLGIGMTFPELPKCSFGDNPHKRDYTMTMIVSYGN